MEELTPTDILVSFPLARRRRAELAVRHHAAMTVEDGLVSHMHDHCG